jgi:hypothetical protein
LHRLFDLVDETGHAGLVIGGVAVGALGAERFTLDIDAAVTVDNDSLEAFYAAAIDRGFFPRVPDHVAFAQQSRMILLKDTVSGVEVDLPMTGTPFEDEALERRILVPLGGRSIPVATPEDLIVMKLVAGRPQDLVDVTTMLDMNHGLDLDRVRHWLAEFDDALDNPGLPAQFETLRAEVNARDA